MSQYQRQECLVSIFTFFGKWKKRLKLLHLMHIPDTYLQQRESNPH